MGNNQIIHGKAYKVFLVEEDDDYRERVMCGLFKDIEITHNEPDTVTDYMYNKFRMSNPAGVTITLSLMPMDDKGTMLRMENFWEVETDDDGEEEEE